MDENQVRALIQELLGEHSTILWKELLIAALNSPVILLLVTAFIIWLLRKHLLKFLSSRDIEIGWGDKQIKLSELSNNIDQELDPVKEQIDMLKQELKVLRGRGKPVQLEKETKSKESEEEIKKRINKALSTSKYRWRSIDSLAKLSLARKEEVLEIIGADGSIVLGRGKNGEELAKFKHR